jgi:hypothetical protein
MLTASRAIFFEGRYPLRTNVLNAILNIDLANSQVSPFETTTPRVLRQRGYESALFGKFHLAGPDNNPFGNGTPRALGWDFFYGFLDGGPRPIDTTAGGVAPSGTYSCGFVPPAAFPGGADLGACYFADHRQCTEIAKSSEHPTPGLTCLESGGIFVPKERCQSPPPGNLNFSQVPQAFNGYYVSPLFIIRDGRPIEEVPPTDPRARGYRTIIETNRQSTGSPRAVRTRPGWRPSVIHRPTRPTSKHLLRCCLRDRWIAAASIVLRLFSNGS